MEKSSGFKVSLLKDETAELEKIKPCKCELVDYQSLPDFLKRNEFIRGYYRSKWPLKQTILSIFSIHNETLNIWTHLIGFFIFLALATTMIFALDTNILNTMPAPATSIYDPMRIHHQVSILHLAQSNQTSNEIELKLTKQVARWPFYAYLGGAMFCLLMSSTCHLLFCHSEHTCYLMLRLDYVGISALIVTSFYPLVYYTFACDPFFRNLYIGFISAFGIATIIISLVPVFESARFMFARTGLFSCMGLAGVVPIVHKMVVYGDRPEAVVTTGYEMVMLTFYGLRAVVYALRIPERWFPGKFDLAGHSHQLWHILVIAGAYTHYLADLVYLNWRHVEGC